MAKLMPYVQTQPARKGGFLSRKIWESDDCWAPDPEFTETITRTSIDPSPTDSKVAEPGSND
jgi:hypothetical protein